MKPDEFDAYLDSLLKIALYPEPWYAVHPKFSQFDVFQPTVSCPKVPLIRYPPDSYDGGKFACNLNKMTSSECVIYSIGSKGEYEFEASMLEHTRCALHTFDCTGDFGYKAPPDVVFHKICIGGKDKGHYLTLPSMMDRLGHERVHYLKMDVEGAEFEAIPLIETLPVNRRPLQIAVEVHVEVKSNGNHLVKLIGFLFLFHDLGYRLISRDDNHLHRCCTELVFVLDSHLHNLRE